MKTAEPPNWQAYTFPDYNEKMQSRCDQLQTEILRDAQLRSEILSDPRSLHRSLFSDFTPEGYGVYAGTYRGTANSVLYSRIISAPRILGDGDYAFVPPRLVEIRLGELLDQIPQLLSSPHDDHTGNLIAISYVFAKFGKIHPFLDGNGHIQRAMFAALATEFGYPLSNRFAIHPRPFDSLLAMALERFANADPSDELGYLNAIVEYLAFFLSGPFDAPGMNLLPE